MALGAVGVLPPFSLQSIERLFEQLAQRHRPFIRHLAKSLDGFVFRLDVELLIAAGPVNTALTARFLRRLRRLPAWEIMVLGNARDHFLFDGLVLFRFRREDRR